MQIPDRSSSRSRGENPTFAAIVSKAAGSSPLTRGKQNVRSEAHCARTGSSPLTRGKHAVALDRVTFARLIPAHAEKTPSHSIAWARRSAHPCSCGENDRPSIQRAMREGSSPLMRGKREDCADDVPDGGLIPAHAGKTSTVVSVSSAVQAHPRSRGENI